MKKKTFLLFEILVAILIVSLCLIPLIKKPLQNFREQTKWLKEMEGERLAEWTFSEIKEKFLSQEISWKNIPSPNTTTGPFFLPPSSICISEGNTLMIQRSFTLRCKGEKEGFKGAIYRNLQVNIAFDPPLCKSNQYSFSVPVRKIPLAEK